MTAGRVVAQKLLDGGGLQKFIQTDIIVGNEITGVWTYKPLEVKKEDTNMDAERIEERLGVDFIKSLYRGSSAYADNLPTDYLEKIHIPVG